MAGRDLNHRGAPSGLMPAALVIAFAAALVFAAPASALQCGDTLTSDTKLRKDLTCAEDADGLEIDANGVKLDLNGHKITGSGFNNSAVHMQEQSGVKVVNGRVNGFDEAVDAAGAANLTVRGLVAKGQTNVAIRVAESQNVEISDNAIRAGFGSAGVLLSGITTSEVEVSGNTIDGAGGIDVEAGDEVTVTANELTDIASDGIEMEAATDSKVSRNSIDNTEQTGIALEEDSSNVVVARNELTSTDGVGILVLGGAGEAQIKRNEVHDVPNDGVLVEDTADAGLIANVVKRAGEDGIDVDDDGTLINDNVANANDELGIESDSANGSGNTAKNNGDPDQCIPASLCE